MDTIALSLNFQTIILVVVVVFFGLPLVKFIFTGKF